MPDWAMDSSGLRHAYSAGALAAVCAPRVLELSPLTWLPAGTPFTSATAPEIRYPEPGGRPPGAPSPFRPTPPPVALCDSIEQLYEAGSVVLADIGRCATDVTVMLEGAWGAAGGLGRLLDESIAAMVVAAVGQLPLVSGDPAVLRVARHCGLKALTVRQFASQVAA